MFRKGDRTLIAKQFNRTKDFFEERKINCMTTLASIKLYILQTWVYVFSLRENVQWSVWLAWGESLAGYEIVVPRPLHNPTQIVQQCAPKRQNLLKIIDPVIHPVKKKIKWWKLFLNNACCTIAFAWRVLLKIEKYLSQSKNKSCK